MNVIDFVSRWLHVSTAIIVVGGTVFVRFVLSPAAEQLSPSEHDRLRALITGTWRKVVMGGIALFLITGFYNYLKVAAPHHEGDKLYHALMGTKIILAFAVFFLASALVGRSATFEGLRRRRMTWQLVLIALAFLIVAISSYLRIRGYSIPSAN